MKKILKKKMGKLNKNVVLYANEGGANNQCWGC